MNNVASWSATATSEIFGDSRERQLCCGRLVCGESRHRIANEHCGSLFNLHYLASMKFDKFDEGGLPPLTGGFPRATWQRRLRDAVVPTHCRPAHRGSDALAQRQLDEDLDAIDSGCKELMTEWTTSIG